MYLLILWYQAFHVLICGGLGWQPQRKEEVKHTVFYPLGHELQFKQTQIWNYNKPAGAQR